MHRPNEQSQNKNGEYCWSMIVFVVLFVGIYRGTHTKASLPDILYTVEGSQRVSLNYLPCFDYGNTSNRCRSPRNAIAPDNFAECFYVVG